LEDVGLDGRAVLKRILWELDVLVWTIYLAKGPVSGFWEHGSDLCLYLCTRCRSAFLIVAPVNSIHYVSYNVPSDFVSRYFSLGRPSSDRLLYVWCPRCHL